MDNIISSNSICVFVLEQNRIFLYPVTDTNTETNNEEDITIECTLYYDYVQKYKPMKLVEVMKNALVLTSSRWTGYYPPITYQTLPPPAELLSCKASNKRQLKKASAQASFTPRLSSDLNTPINILGTFHYKHC